MRQVLVPLVVDALDLEDIAELAEALDGDAGNSGDSVEYGWDGEEVGGEDERVREARRDEAQEDGESEGDGLSVRGLSGCSPCRDRDGQNTQRGSISASKKCRTSSSEIPPPSSSRAETCSPVTNKKAPTPPIVPTRMWRGKNSLRRPSFITPRAPKARPVRMDERAKAIIVVATSVSSSSMCATSTLTIEW